MGLLSAVGSHVATALENGRLYRQLQLKATELQRLQEFNENIVESLDDGLVVEDLNGRVVRWNRALAEMYGLSAAEAITHKLEEVFDGPFVEALRAAQREAPGGASLYRVPLAGRAVTGRRAPPRQHRDGSAEGAERTVRHVDARATSSSSKT